MAIAQQIHIADRRYAAPADVCVTLFQLVIINSNNCPLLNSSRCNKHCVFCSPAIYGICNCNLALLLLWSAQKQKSKKPPNYLFILRTSTFLKTVFVLFVAPDYNYKSHFLRYAAHGRMLHSSGTRAYFIFVLRCKPQCLHPLRTLSSARPF